jgi:hypothetical protein
MLPISAEIPAAAVLLVSGVLACFAGYRLFKFVVAVYGFILGAALMSSMMGVSSTGGMVAAAIFGGIAGAVILVLAYYIGVALVGAGFGVLVAHVGWNYLRGTSDPPLTVVVGLAVLGAVGSMLLQRYVVIVATAFGGAWTTLLGGLTLAGDHRISTAASSGDVWILYPMAPTPEYRWVPTAWLVLSLVGIAVQLGVTGRKRKSL